MNAEQIKKLRNRLGLTISALAREVGVQRSTVYRWEDGTFEPKGAALKLLQALESPQPAKSSKRPASKAAK